MNDQAVVKMVVCGLIALGALGMVLNTVRPSGELVALAGTCVGGLASLLASTRKDAA